jgi:hypothetical protein
MIFFYIVDPRSHALSVNRFLLDNRVEVTRNQTEQLQQTR